MPSWLLLIVVIACFVAAVGLQAAGSTGRWRTVWEASRQFAAYLALLAAPAVVVWLVSRIW